MDDLSSAWDKATPVPLQNEWDKAVPTNKPSRLGGAGIVNVPELLSKAGNAIGGFATDVAAKYLPPEVAAGIGTAADVGTQSIAPVGLGKVASTVAAPTMERAGKWLMGNALKPSLKDVRTGKAATAVDTLLERGINPTGEGIIFEGGAAKLHRLVDDLNSKVTSTIANSTATVDKASVASRIQDIISKIERRNPTPQDAVADAEKVYNNFMLNQLIPARIPIQQAQELKQGIQQILRDEYGKVSTATNSSKKALGAGFREDIAAAEPSVAPLNAAEAKLLDTLSIVERRALTEANRNPMSLALLAHNPASFAAFMADKSSLFKSLVARMLYSGSERIPQALVGGGAAVGQGILSQQPQGILSQQQ